MPVQTTDDQHHTHGHTHTHGHEHWHEHGDGHYHSHPHADGSEKELSMQNLVQAERNRGMFEAKNIFAVKIVSSQGAGKTMLIEKSIDRLKNASISEDKPKSTIDPDENQIAEVKSINLSTTNAVQPVAEMVYKSVKTLEIKDKSILFIENLTSIPSKEGFTDSGEKRKVFVFSVTEGDNKAVKYPELFSDADVCVISKTDLLPYVDFDAEKAKRTILALNPAIRFFEISAKTGSGIDEWISWMIEEFENFSK
jgi:hydrogenase nickel incorporation protein HypB